MLECINLSHTYHDGENDVNVLKNVNLAVKEGESVAIIGSSGSGKSTLLHLLGSLDTPSEGQILFAGQDISGYSSSQLARLRNQQMGFIYQFHHLLPEFSALENVAMPLLIQGQTSAQANAEAAVWLEKVALAHRANHYPEQLSGGERQRVAIARAMITRPQLILADEPTGNLDEQTGQMVFDLLLQLQQSARTALVIVTHDLQLAQQLDSRYRISQGTLAPCA
jgi:lipoprotein-releasing system ATP-binding protein